METEFSKYEKEYIINNFDRMPVQEIAEHVCASVYAVSHYARAIHLSKPTEFESKQPPTYRTKVTRTTRFLICVNHFEKISDKITAKMFKLNIKCIPTMTKSMIKSGEYARHINTFKNHNRLAFNKALQKWE